MQLYVIYIIKHMNTLALSLYWTGTEPELWNQAQTRLSVTPKSINAGGPQIEDDPVQVGSTRAKTSGWPFSCKATCKDAFQFLLGFGCTQFIVFCPEKCKEKGQSQSLLWVGMGLVRVRLGTNDNIIGSTRTQLIY